jgi:predicted RNase H-like HicB family nuclease
MRHEFTAVFEVQEDWIVAYCPEVPGANGQGRTKEAARESLAEAIVLILEDRRDDGLRGVPADAEREVISVDIPST